MDLARFRDITKEICSNYFRNIQRNISNGLIQINEDAVVLYPNMLLLVDTEKYFIFELFGVQNGFKGFTIPSVYKTNSVQDYLSQFKVYKHDSLINVTADGISMHGFQFCPSDINLSSDAQFIAKNLFDLNNYPKFNRLDGEGSYLNFGSRMNTFLLTECVFVNRNESIYRVKYSKFMLVVRKTIKPDKYKRSLVKQLKPIVLNHDNNQISYKGVTASFKEQTPIYELLSEMQSLYLTSHLNETVITRFLGENILLLEIAFNSKSVIPERILEWQLGADNAGNDMAIKPDFLIKRDDGYYNIVDFKLAIDKFKKATKGEAKRRRFVDYINTGISQLTHYKTYINSAENKTYLKTVHNLEFLNPKLILIVGNYENIDQESVSQALRPYKNDIEIMDYDTLTSMIFVNAKLVSV